MRNFSEIKKHLPAREFSKVIRFNSKDYILHSLYDSPDERTPVDNREQRRNIYKSHSIDDDQTWNDINDGVGNFVNEGFLKSAQQIYNKIQSEPEKKSEIKNILKLNVYTSDGENIEIDNSKDRIKNILLCMIKKLMKCDYMKKYKSVDDYVYGFGTNQYVFPMDKITFTNGVISFWPKKGGDLKLRINFIDNVSDPNFVFIHDNISINNKSSIVLTYEEFQKLLTYDVVTIKNKDVIEYYSYFVPQVINQFIENNVHLYIFERRTNISSDILNIGLNEWKEINMYFLRNKEDKTPESIMEYIKRFIKINKYTLSYSEDKEKYTDDDVYIAIGGNSAKDKKFTDGLKYAYLFSEQINNKEDEMIFSKFHTKSETGRNLERNLIFIPMTRFIMLLPVFYMYMFDDGLYSK
jgi:hypothetical protein